MKKAQIEYMETIFVLLILIIIIFIGLVIIYSFYTKSLNKKGENIQNIDAVTLTSSIINMPEFTCGNTKNCIDAMKILAFQQVLHDKPIYKILFKNMDINIEIVYPEANSNTCDINTFQDLLFPKNCNKFEIYKSQISTQNKEIIQSPVQIYFPSIEKRALGVLNIVIYK